MKRSLIIPILIAGLLTVFADHSQAQSLSFSSVIWGAVPDTVPAGKVWKLSRFVNTHNSYARYVSINGENIGYIEYVSYGIGAMNNGGTPHSDGPLWLPAGTIIGGNPEIRFSAIEFSVTP